MQIPSQAANTRRFKHFGHIARHPESLEHKIIYRSCHSFRSRSSPYRVGRPRAHWAEVTSAQLIQRIVWLSKRPPPQDWDISHPLRKPISQPEVWFIHGHSLHDFYKQKQCTNLAGHSPEFLRQEKMEIHFTFLHYEKQKIQEEET